MNLNIDFEAWIVASDAVTNSSAAENRDLKFTMDGIMNQLDYSLRTSKSTLVGQETYWAGVCVDHQANTPDPADLQINEKYTGACERLTAAAHGKLTMQKGFDDLRAIYEDTFAEVWVPRAEREQVSKTTSASKEADIAKLIAAATA